MKQKIHLFLQNEFIRGGFFLTISFFLINLLNYVFNFLAGRFLGPKGFGDLTALFSYITICSVPLSVLGLILIQKIRSTQYNPTAYMLTLEDFFWTCVRRWKFLLIPLLLLSFVIPRITNLSNESSFLLIPLILISFIGSFYISVLNGLKLFKGLTWVNALSTILKVIGPIIAIMGIGGIHSILFFFSLSTIAMAYFGYKFTHHHARKESNITKGKIEKKVVHIIFSQQVLVTTLSILALTIFNNIDIIFVKKFFSQEATGFYSSWALFAKIILYAITPLTSLSFIFFAGKNKHEEEKKTFLWSLFLLLIIGIASFIIYSTFSSFIIAIFFGSRFNAVIPDLGRASIFGTLYTGITFLNNYFLAKKDKFALILPFCIPFNIILLFFNKQRIENIMNMEIYFAIVIFFFYLIAWVKRAAVENTTER